MFYGAPASRAPDGREVGATRALLRSFNALLKRSDVTHVAVAFDHVIESFRNELFDGYKTGQGIEPALRQQFDLAEEAAHALGLVVWPMIELEADDGLAAGVAAYGDDPQVEQIVLCSPDKDLAQCVSGKRVVMWDRRKDEQLDEDGVWAKFGVAPESIPDYLALVGDAADGIPGLPGWGAKSSAAILARYGRLEAIPDDVADWEVKVRGAAKLGQVLLEQRREVALYRQLATLRVDIPPIETLHELRWQGARKDDLEALCERLGEQELLARILRFRTTTA
ncbi:MAG: flap endonuclease [Proteobacteria bacterium]|nr:MAG: flap endonuclease [Pseudomonadota bacterium]